MNGTAEIVQLGVDRSDPVRLPRITLIIPVLNEEDSIGLFLDRATEVIRANADRATFDFLFVNDGSTDAHWAVVLIYA